MGRRGPKRTPSVLRIMRGTFRSDRGSPNEPQPPAGAVCPKWLAREAKAEWKRLAPWLESQGLLTLADQSAFCGYCAAWSRWIRFEKLVQKERAADVAIGQGYVNAATKALQQLTQILARFGLSPSDRNQVVAKPPSERSKLGRFLDAHGEKREGAERFAND